MDRFQPRFKLTLISLLFPLECKIQQISFKSEEQLYLLISNINLNNNNNNNNNNQLMIEQQQQKQQQDQQQKKPTSQSQWNVKIELTYSLEKWKCEECLLTLKENIITFQLRDKTVLNLPYQCLISTGRNMGKILLFTRLKEEPGQDLEQEQYDDEGEEYEPQQIVIIRKIRESTGEEILINGSYSLLIEVNNEENYSQEILFEEVLSKMSEFQKRVAKEPVSNLFNFQEGEEEEEKEEEQQDNQAVEMSEQK